MTEAHVAAGIANVAANRNGRIEIRLFHDQRDEPGGRRLAVGSGHCDAELSHPQQLAEHLGARDHRNLQLARSRDFRIRKFYRRRDDHRVDSAVVLQMRRMMPLTDFRAERREPRDGRGRFQIASADAHPELQAQLGDSAHARAADADEMQPALTRQETICMQFSHAAACSATSKQIFAMWRAASGCASSCARKPISSSLAGLLISASSSRARFGASCSSSRTIIAPPRFSITRALCTCCWSLWKGYGTKIAARAPRAMSVTVIAPERAITRSARCSALAMSSINGTTSAANPNSRYALLTNSTSASPVWWTTCKFITLFPQILKAPTTPMFRRCAPDEPPKTRICNCLSSRGDRSGRYRNRVGLPVTATLD